MEIKDKVWHSIVRTVSVVAVVGVLVGPYILGYQQGKAKGMANCMKDRPTSAYDVQRGATLNVTHVQSNPKDKPVFIGIKIMRVGIGVSIDRK